MKRVPDEIIEQTLRDVKAAFGGGWGPWEQAVMIAAPIIAEAMCDHLATQLRLAEREIERLKLELSIYAVEE